jgi:iron complex outermembrane receptor protein
MLLMSGACGVLASSIGTVLAQDSSDVSEVVIVTGSYIRGSAEDAALPIDVISAEDLQKSGSPSMVDVLKNLSVSSGALGDTNQFAAGAQGTEGTGSVNLRNLGRQRTLVLLNGRRLVNAPQSGSPDTNLLPLGAIGRIEVLKDGAAATYGSDAIGGVVNFITNDRLEGLSIGGNYKYIEDTEGDYDAKLSWGWQGDSSSVVLSAGYQHRSELRVTDRDFATPNFSKNPQGFSSGGNPGTIAIPGAAAPIRDPDCAALGSVVGVTDGGVPACYFAFTPFDNLVEKQDQYQFYGEYNFEFGEASKLHVEGFYSQTDVPEYRTSPSFLTNQSPTVGGGPGNTPIATRFVIPVHNPGVQNFIRQNPTLINGLTDAAKAVLNNPNGNIINLNPLFRPFGVGGNPKTGSTNISMRKADAFRVSAALTGEVSPALRWDFGLTYMENNYLTTANDIPVTRLQAALKGFGGFNCQGVTPGQNGCLYYNPFGNGIQRNAITGQVNPNFVPGSENTPEVAQFLFGKNDLDRKATTVVVDAVFSGETGLKLPGGNLGWAAGAQFREEDFRSQYSDLNNYALNPCVNPGLSDCLIDPISGQFDPARATGIFNFAGGGFDNEALQNIYAVFGEASLPITESLSAQLAARYEDYGGSVGDTFDPKFSLRWQTTDWLALRGSIGTSFRGPPSNILNNNSATAQQFIQAAGGFRGIRIFGNPDLKPESATTFNIGVLFSAGGFKASLDYFNYDFKDNFTIEDFTAIVSQVFPNNMANCASPLAQRVVFAGNGTCIQGGPASNLTAVRVFNINGSGLEEDGIDLDAEYLFNGVLGGELRLGVNVSYVLGFDVKAQSIEGVPVVPAFDGAGRSNVNTGFTPLPDLKGNFFIDWSRGIHNVRAVARYVSSYLDTRSFLDAQRNIFVARPSTFGQAVTAGRRIDDNVQLDINYVVQLPEDLTIAASISNVADEDPSFARNELGYDPTTGSPIGRAIEIGISKKF